MDYRTLPELHFRSIFLHISDHEALLTLLKLSPKGNKTFFSRLNSWYDGLLPYGFKIEQRPRSKMLMAHYLLKYPSTDEPPQAIMILHSLLPKLK